MPPHDLSILNSHPASLSCLASGFPQPQIKWFKKDTQGNFQVLQLNHRIKQLKNGSLFFGVTQALDDGIYYCEASFDSENLPSLSSKEVNLQVRGMSLCFVFPRLECFVEKVFFYFRER